MVGLRIVPCLMWVGLCGLLDAQSGKHTPFPIPTAEFPVLKGDYLGQRPPGDTPVVFAPGIISKPTTVEHGFPTFSHDGNEVFWQANSLDQEKIQVLSMRRVEGRWTPPKVSPFGGGPVFSPDGKRLYYLPLGEAKGKENGPHVVEKVGNEWSEPRCLHLLARFPELKFVYHLSITHKGTLYFLGHAPGRGLKNDMGIYRLESVNGTFTKPELLPPSINTPGGILNWTPFIAPDESYLLFSSTRIDAQQDLFLCFRRPDGSWTEAISLGASINTKWGERYPAVSPDGKYVFFTRWVSEDNEDVFWVSAGILDRLKAKVLEEGQPSSCLNMGLPCIPTQLRSSRQPGEMGLDLGRQALLTGEPRQSIHPLSGFRSACELIRLSSSADRAGSKSGVQGVRP